MGSDSSFERPVNVTSTNNRLDLARLDADVTIRPACSISDELAGERICELAFKVYGAESYLSANRSFEFDAHSWLGISKSLSNSPAAAWQDANVADHIILRADSFLTLRDAAELGMGLALLPCFVGDLSNILVPVNQYPVSLNTGVWITAHKSRSGLPRIRAFLNFFVEALGADIPLLNGSLSDNG